jgi:hypothetical protein
MTNVNDNVRISDNIGVVASSSSKQLSSIRTLSLPFFILNILLNANIISITSVTEDDVIKAFKQLKPKLTTGPDKIPAFIVRDCMYVFVRPLTRIFNLILNSGKFPSQWKTSRIYPVYKKGEKSEINNYRPIAIICNFAKIFELLLHTFFHRHVSRTLSPHQHGFMKWRSVETNLVSLTQFLAEALNENKQVDVIYSAFFLTVAIGNCMVKLIPPVNFCSDENIQTIFGTKLEDCLNYRIDYNSIS